MTDPAVALRRVARRHGWDEAPSNTLDYYTLRFLRDEPEGRTSVVRVRITSRVVDVQAEIGGLRQSFTLPTLHRVEQLLAADPPRPVRYAPLAPEHFTRLEDSVDRWREKPPRDLADAVRVGDEMAESASEVLRKAKGDK